MIRFFKYILIIGTLVFTIGIVLNEIYDYIFINTSARDKTQLALKEKQTHIDYVFVGSSRVENYIDCSLIESITGKSCRNFAMSGGSHQDAFVLLNLLKKQGLTYSHLFIQLDTSIKKESMTKAFKASLIPLIEHYDIKIENVDLSLTWSESKIPFYKYAEYDYIYGIRDCFAQLYKNKKGLINLGYQPKYTTGSANATKIENLSLSNSFIELTRKEVVKDNAQIHFFTSPYCPAMLNTKAFDQFKLKYPGYINYASFYQDVEYFANCTHMNDRGAKVFTKQIIKDFNL